MANFQIKENITKRHSGIVKQYKTFVAKEIYGIQKIINTFLNVKNIIATVIPFEKMQLIFK